MHRTGLSAPAEILDTLMAVYKVGALHKIGWCPFPSRVAIDAKRWSPTCFHILDFFWV